MNLQAQARHNAGPISAAKEHARLTAYIEQRYNERHLDDQAFDDVIEACERMIQIAPVVADYYFRKLQVNRGTAGRPHNRGFERLISIREMQNRFDEAATLQKLYEAVWK